MKRIFYKAGDNFKRLLTGKAFYAVLTVCVLLIGVTGYIAARQTLNKMGEALNSADDSLWETSDALDSLYAGENENTEDAALVQNSEDTSAEDANAAAPPAEDETAALIPDEIDSPSATEVSEPENTPAESVSNVSEKRDDDVPVSYTAPIYIKPLEGLVLMPFAVETLAYSNTMRDWRSHVGIDIAGEPGTRVVAITDGVVEDVYEDELYGWSVALSHKGDLISIYRCLSPSIPVSIGESVKRGDVIGGVSGDDSLMEAGEPPHLHFELIRNGGHIDPAELFG